MPLEDITQMSETEAAEYIQHLKDIGAVRVETISREDWSPDDGAGRCGSAMWLYNKDEPTQCLKRAGHEGPHFDEWSTWGFSNERVDVWYAEHPDYFTTDLFSA